MTGSACDLFLSYKAEDRTRLRPLVAALESDGFSIWWDAHIAGGANWRREIEDHLDAARCVIVAWSKRSIAPEGEFVRDEARRARRLGTYLPVRIDAVEPPLGFGEIQALPLNGWKGRKDDPRYVALIAAVRAQLSGAAHDPDRAVGQYSMSRRTVAVGSGIAALSVAGGGAWLLLKPAQTSAEGIAVMPFANLSGDQGQDWFSDGLAEELRTALSRVGLKVIGRASSEAVKNLDSQAAAAKLHIGNILSGSVRRSPQTIRVSAQLISGADGTEKWAQSYDRPPGDAIRIQSDIATNVAQALSVAIGQASRAAIALGGTSDSAAEQMLLKARKLRRGDSSPETLMKVLALADSAMARDPRYGRAYVTKGEVLSTMAASYTFGVEQVHAKFQLALAVAEQALAIAPQYGAAESLLSDIKGKMLDFVGALQSAETAVTLPADDPEMLWPAIRTLAYTSDLRRALELTRRTMSIDPLSGRGFGLLAEVLLRSGQYPAAIRAGQRAIALAPKLFEARVYTALSLIMAGQNEAANGVMAPIPSNYTFPRLIKAVTAARTGDRALAERTLQDMRMFDGDVSSYQYAQIHSQLGQGDEALAALNKALEVRDPGLIAVRVDAFLDPIRRHSKFADLLRRLNLPGA